MFNDRKYWGGGNCTAIQGNITQILEERKINDTVTWRSVPYALLSKKEASYKVICVV